MSTAADNLTPGADNLTPGVPRFALRRSFATKRFQRLMLLLTDGPPLRAAQIARLHAALDAVPVLPEDEPARLADGSRADG